MSFLDGNVNEKKDRTRKPNEGVHTLYIESLEMLKTRDHGEVPMMKARVAKSTVDKVGAQVGEAWFVNDGSELQRSYTRGDALGFGRALAASIGKDGADTELVKALMKDLYMNPEHQKNQPLRGLAIQCTTTPRQTKAGRDVLNASYAPISQTGEQLAVQRKQVDAWISGVITEEKAAAVTASFGATSAPVVETKKEDPPAQSSGGFLGGLGIR